MFLVVWEFFLKKRTIVLDKGKTSEFPYAQVWALPLLLVCHFLSCSTCSAAGTASTLKPECQTMPSPILVADTSGDRDKAGSSSEKQRKVLLVLPLPKFPWSLPVCWSLIKAALQIYISVRETIRCAKQTQQYSMAALTQPPTVHSIVMDAYHSPAAFRYSTVINYTMR